MCFPVIKQNFAIAVLVADAVITPPGVPMLVTKSLCDKHYLRLLNIQSFIRNTGNDFTGSLVHTACDVSGFSESSFL